MHDAFRKVPPGLCCIQELVLARSRSGRVTERMSEHQADLPGHRAYRGGKCG